MDGKSADYERGYIAALRETAQKFKGRMIWPGDLRDMADEIEGHKTWEE